MIPARPGLRDTRPARDWTDTAIEWASGTTAVAMFAYGVSLSYSVLHRIANAAGLPAWASDLWPLGFEAFMASAALNALADQRQRHQRPEWWQRVPWYPWVLTALTAGGSILLNWFHPAIPLDPPPGWLRSVVYGLPPLAAVFAWHLFLQRVTHRHHLRPAAPDTLDGPVDTTVQRLDTPDSSGQPVDGEGVRALSSRDTSPVHPMASDTPRVHPPVADAGAGPPERATPHSANGRAAGQGDAPAAAEPAPSEVDAPPIHQASAPAETNPAPSTVDPEPDAPGVQAADGPVDTRSVQPAAVSAPRAGGARDRLAAAYTGGRPGGGAWSARTLAVAAGCGRSTAAAFL